MNQLSTISLLVKVVDSSDTSSVTVLFGEVPWKAYFKLYTHRETIPV